MLEWLGQALEYLVSTISVDNPTGLMAIFFLTVMADIGIPFPFALDTILFVTVYKTGVFSLPVLLILALLLVGRFAGTSLLYGLGYGFGFKFANYLSRRSRLFAARYAGFRSKLEHRPVIPIVIARLTPGLMQVASLAAGTLRINYFKLSLSILLTSLIYDGIVITLGYLARLGFSNLTPEMSVWVVLGFLAILISVFIIHMKKGKTAKYYISSTKYQ